MISSSSYDQLRRAIVGLGLIPSQVKPKTQKLVFTVPKFDAQHYKNGAVNDGDENF